MKPIALIVASMTFVVCGVVTILIVRGMASDMAFLGLVIGALIGTQAGVIMHHRQPGAALTGRIKAILGGTLAVTCVVLGLILQSMWHCFEYPDVSISIGAAGSFVFPFVIAGNLWKALEKRGRKDDGAG